MIEKAFVISRYLAFRGCRLVYPCLSLLPLVLFVCAPLSAVAEMDARGTSVNLVAVLPERIVVVASPEAVSNNNDGSVGTTSLTVTTTWTTNPQRSSISVYLDASSPDVAGAQLNGFKEKRRGNLPADQPLFEQELTVGNRNASRTDRVEVPAGIKSNAHSDSIGHVLKLRVQTL